MKFSVIVPAYNEEERIRDNLIEIRNTLASELEDFEILAVDDGSTDNTRDEILKACERFSEIRYCGYGSNRGKGGAIKHGAMEAAGDVTGFIDADLDIAPRHLLTYLRHMDETSCDIVIGSKMHEDSKLDYPPLRKFFSRGYYVMLKVLFGMNIKDTQTGIKLYRTSLIKRVAPYLRVRGYAFDIEILALCSHEGAVIDEMPVDIVFRRDASFGRIRAGDIIRMFGDTLGIWWNLKIRRSYFK